MNAFAEFIKDLVWPRSCEICGRECDRPARHVCSECLMRLPFAPTDGLCRVCGRDAAGFDGDFLCDDCRERRPSFDRAAAALRFEGEARELVNAFKFRSAFHLRDDLVDFAEGAVRVRLRLEKVDCVTPVPSTAAHRYLRGYSQCAILARRLAARLGRRYEPLLVRTGSPARQRGLSEDERRENVIGTFAVAGRGAARFCAAGPGVLLVDDIMTTGSTLSEAAKTLKEAGAGAVYCAALARTVR